ncbi:FMN-dependent oxidoreductase (nitrilotriacetate monooxygenase family) [Neomicrococcus aestuarii]|uniref:FMN-dependent oxidoreductase (Nitrilotriacetate monooxygenase family) n=1 Tax=Neomicrococcus aestuarii TaxID=556325 RepID=A0A7W8TW60_9MICC|nr:LLM class flavin-dependent oxidoreductase [Neomicrococcus aestuarii]MBB5513220.1 FMN-dependent oxidoreductase (nitrilotriacetate monooxygenase family) [Neomicrococcus aestuarii]
MNTASHILQGTSRRPEAEQTNFNDLDHWIDLAKTLEKGKFYILFFADVVGLYGNHRGSYQKFVEAGLQIPSNDPSVIASAIAYATNDIGIAITSSVLQEHPFNFARRISTLDHATKGRIARNIVTNSLQNAARNFGQDLTPHDERYVWADEYMDVVYKLWEGSWDEGALLQDKEKGIHADYSKVHKINHVGKRYEVEGPHLVAPSPQRTPLLFQAGSSPAGRDFAARNAELQFIITPSPEKAAGLIQDTRRRVFEAGRNAEDLKFMQGLSFVIGSTEAEARAKEVELEESMDLDAMVAHLGGAIGVDFGHHSLDTPLGDIEASDGTRSIIEWTRQSVEGREATVEDLGRLQGRNSRVVGTPEQIADKLQAWADAGVDGINVINATRPGSYVDFIEHVIPVLQERGLAKSEYGEGTSRKRIFGTDYLPERHVAASYRGAFSNQLEEG